MQDNGLAEEISLEEDIAVFEGLVEFLLGFDLLGEQTHMSRQNLAQAFAFLRILRDSKVHLDDVRHVDKRLVARQKDEVVEGNFVSLVLELLYGLQNRGRRLYRLENLHNNAVCRQKLRRTVQQIFFGKVDERLLVRDEFFHAEVQHGIHHDALCRHVSVETRIESILETAAKENLVCVYVLFLIQYGLPPDKCFFHKRAFLCHYTELLLYPFDILNYSKRIIAYIMRKRNEKDFL